MDESIGRKRVRLESRGRFPFLAKERTITESVPPTAGGPSNPSGSSVTHGHIFALNDDGHLAHPAGMLQHLLELGRIRLDVKKFSTTAVCRPGIFSIGSAHLAIDRYFLAHDHTLRIIIC